MNGTISSLLRDVPIGSLATTNPDGSPWNSPLHFAATESHLYWFSSEAAAHSQNIARDPRVSIAIWSPDESEGPRGLYINTTAQPLSAEDAEEAKVAYAAKFGSVPAFFADFTAYAAPLGTIDEDRSGHGKWYITAQEA